ncbi:MAG: type II toxin-antitoxin system prevent-host-death family antitoxin, partial [Acidobacteria bacterium]|nr:type II toxin-antitoxin system prevent-host-death family antitoxin [Acidobacteriota bacterium]
MPVVNVHEAKTQLSRLLAQVEAGTEVVIARRGQPVAKLVRCKPGAKRQ